MPDWLLYTIIGVLVVAVAILGFIVWGFAQMAGSAVDAIEHAARNR
jgi:hypothetical protein